MWQEETGKELSRIERELVLQYLRDDNVPVTVTLEQKPQQQDANLSGGTTSLDDDSRVPASAIFPVAIPAQQMTVLEQGIILLKNSMRETMRTIQPFLGKTVRVQFYFNRMGLYFITTMKECSQGLALVVPSAIYRIPDTTVSHDYEFSASLSYDADGGSPVSLSCISVPEYPLFTLPAWGDIELSKQKDAKAILELIVENVRAGKEEPIGNGLHLFPVCRFLTNPPAQEAESVQGRMRPYTVLYVDEGKLVLGSTNPNEVLQKGQTYSLALSFAVKAHSAFRRVIRTSARAISEFRFAEEDNAACFVLSFEDIKEEDIRFLYERLRGKRMED